MNANDLRGMWAGIAGVKFPEQQPAKKTRRKPSLKPKLPDTNKWVSSIEAAKSAGCTRAIIYEAFRYKKFRKKLCRGEDGVLRAYWRRSDVDKIIDFYRGKSYEEKGKRVVNYVPEGYVTYKEARKRIGCSRSSIHRMLSRNQLRSVYVKITGEHKQRMICADDLAAVAERFAANRDKKRGGCRQTLI